MRSVDVFVQAAATEVFTADCLQPLACLRAVPTSFGIAAQIAQDGTGLYRRQLILVTEQHQTSMGRQCVEQIGHHFQVDHRGFVHHQYIQRQAIAGVVPEMPGAGTTAEQTVHGGHIRRDLLPHRFSNFQGLNLLADGLGQSCGSFASGCRETNAQRFASLNRGCLEQCEQAHDRGGFASSRAAGDDAECAAGGQGASELLPVDHFIRPGWTEQASQALGQITRCCFVCSQALTQGVIDAPFVSPVAAQVQAFTRQHQRPVLRGLTPVDGQSHQAAGRQDLAPMSTVQRLKQL